MRFLTLGLLVAVELLRWLNCKLLGWARWIAEVSPVFWVFSAVWSVLWRVFLSVRKFASRSVQQRGNRLPLVGS